MSFASKRIVGARVRLVTYVPKFVAEQLRSESKALGISAAQGIERILRQKIAQNSVIGGRLLRQNDVNEALVDLGRAVVVNEAIARARANSGN